MKMRLLAVAPTALFLIAASSIPAAAQIPSFAEVTGHEFGERITVHHEMVAYLKTLDEVSDRVRVIEQGETWEKRLLLVAIVTAPENHARLEEIRQAAHQLSDARITGPNEAARIMENQPVILWYGGSIHGNELSGAEGLLKLLEHLTTRSDAATMEVLQNAVILIDPMLNPDGRDAFTNLNHQNLGRIPNPLREDWNNDFTRWQGTKFRTGHYYFDTNRDWFAHTQRETQARVPTILAWRPQVVVDAHEMGTDSEFFFDPGVDPYAPYFPEHSKRWFDIFMRAYAAAFDSAGFEYTTRELFDYFYPGYTTAMRYLGAVGMLYEKGSSRGLAINRSDETTLTLEYALEYQYLAAWTAARTSVRERSRLLSEYYESLRADLAEGGQGIRRYLVAPEGDPLHVAELVNMLMRNGIEVSVLTQTARLNNVRDREGTSVGSRDFPAGTYVVEAAQPLSRLVRTLLEPDTPTPEEFLREARARIERAESPRFYDITAWSLPLLFNVGGYSTSDARNVSAERVSGQVVPSARTMDERPGYAYLIDGSAVASLSALYHLEAQGYRTAAIQKPTRIAGRDIASGTVIVRVAQNDESVHEAVREVAERFRLTVRGTESGLADPGFPVLGSVYSVTKAHEPKIAILAEGPISGYSFGSTWYTLDQQYEIPVTVLRVGSVSNRDIGHFNVIIVPSVSGAALRRELGDSGVERLTQWIRDGGTLVTLASATDFARDLELIDLRSWYDLEENEDAQRFNVPGAIFAANLNEHHWMTAGFESMDLPVLVNSSRIYLPPEGPPSSSRTVIATYGPKISGHAWPETLERLDGAVFAYEQNVGGGRVIAFAEDINFRALWRGANRLLLNAVILGPSE
ncbi:MAG: hypothetical protein GTO46_03875 [Gemmatimonadetes bacterium]|nr:hypothetical protein [Gemmatimonadota bacterium]NIO32939.1 hypothetical protein [Gemmatimonadota bacterium]